MKRQLAERRASAEDTIIADQLAEELDYVAAGQLDGRLVVCRYTGRQLLGAMCHWGLTSERTRQLEAIRSEA